MQRTSEPQRPRSLLTDGLIVAGATAAAYLLTFAYEYGYCTYFGIPGFLIEPSTGTVLFSALCFSVAGIILVEASHLPRELLAKMPWPRLRTRIVLLAFIWGGALLMGRPLYWLPALNLSLWTLLILSDYIFALTFGSGPFTARISQGEKNAESPSSPWDGPTRIFGATAVGLVLIAYFTMAVAWVAGTVHARFQEGFVVLKSTKDMAVIKRYGDRFVAIRYAGALPRATGEFRVIDREQNMEFINLEKLSIGSVLIQPNSDRSAEK